MPLIIGLIIMIFSTTLGNYVYSQGDDNEGMKERELNGADLWSQNCSRCHNIRSPQEFNDAQWEIIVNHMRIIGGIPAAEARAIIKFLQETNNPPPEPFEPVSKDLTSVSTGDELNIDIKEGDTVNGKALYEKNCAACHGNSGKGDGPAAVSMSPKPKNLRDREYVQTLSDSYLIEIITYGGASVDKSALMPGWGNVLTQKEIIDITSYVRELSE